MNSDPHSLTVSGSAFMAQLNEAQEAGNLFGPIVFGIDNMDPDPQNGRAKKTGWRSLTITFRYHLDDTQFFYAAILEILNRLRRINARRRAMRSRQ